MARTAYGNELLYQSVCEDDKVLDAPEKPTAASTAEKHLQNQSLRKQDGTPYSLWDCLKDCSPLKKECGIGLFLYLYSMRFFAGVFMLLAVLDAYQLVLDYDGKYYAERDQTTYFPCLGNSPSLSLNPNTTQADAQKTYERLMSLRQSQVAMDASYTLIFILLLFFYIIRTRFIIEEHCNSNPTLANYALKLVHVPERLIPELIGFIESKGIPVHEVVPVRHMNKLLAPLHHHQSKQYLKLLRRLADVKPRYEIYKVNTESRIAIFESLPRSVDVLEKSHSLIVVFQTREARMKALQLFQRPSIIQLALKSLQLLFPTCLQRKWHLAVGAKQVAVPSEIYWENIRKKQYIYRILIYYINLVVILGAAAVIFALRGQQNNIRGGSYANPDDTSTKLDKKSGAQSGSIKLIISLCVTIINFAIPWLLSKILTTQEKQSTLPRIKLSSMLKNFIFLLINTSFIILIVNADFSDFKVYYVLRMIDSRFKDYSRDWYLEVGYSITMSMFFCIFSPHLVWCLYYRLKRLMTASAWRHFDTQLAYNHWIIGGNLDLAYKTAFQLVVIYGCFMYSGGMPLLLPICSLVLFSIFAADVYLLRYAPKPQETSTILHSWFLKLLPGSVLIHCAFSAYMYGADSIFPHISPNEWAAGLPSGRYFEELEYIKGVKNPPENRATDYCGITFLVLSGIAVGLPLLSTLIQRWLQQPSQAHAKTMTELLQGNMQGGKSYYIFKNDQYSEFYKELFQEPPNTHQAELVEFVPDTTLKYRKTQVFSDDSGNVTREWSWSRVALNSVA